METRSVDADLAGLTSTLRALQQTHMAGGEWAEKKIMWADCIATVTRYLLEAGARTSDLQPLIDIESELRRQIPVFLAGKNRRKRELPSDALLARASAVIDLLVRGGASEEEAAQTMMRQLLAARVPPLKKGGDARAWKRLLLWRANLLYGVASEEAISEYRAFSRELEKIPAQERVKRVLDEQPWDKRRGPPART